MGNILEHKNTLKDIVLKQTHIDLGAKMVPFAGFNMPLQYEGLLIEHQTVREKLGVFDVSHMGEFIISGNEALELIQWVTTNDASKLEIGHIQYSCLPNDNGGIVDDLLVYRLDVNEYMLVVNASNIEKDFLWISQNNKFNAQLKDISNDLCLFAIQGPQAIKAIQKLTNKNLYDLNYYSFTKATFCGIEDIIISATGYTGAGGFEIYIPNRYAVHCWDLIMEAGKEFGIKPIGLAARDTLRLEKGYCLYGNDITDTTSPIEAGLSWITKFNKTFINLDYIAEQKLHGTKRILVAFQMIEKGIPRKDYKVFEEFGSEIGTVTSGTHSPTLNIGIGLAYIDSIHKGIDNKIFIQIRDNFVKAKIIKLPFVS